MHALRQSHERVKASLSSRRSGTDGEQPAASVADLRSWSAAQLTGMQKKDVSKAWNFRDFERSFREEPARAAFPQPASLPPIPDNIEAGPFPSLEEVLSRVGRCETVVGAGGSDYRVRAHLRVVKLACIGSVFSCICSCYSYCIRAFPTASETCFGGKCSCIVHYNIIRVFGLPAW